MRAGVSTACLYPALLEEALEALLRAGIDHVELFINADSDVTPARERALENALKAAGADCVAVHPFTCVIEPLALFSDYERRVEDMIDYYRKYFALMQRLSAKYFILHGNNKVKPVSMERYCERFERLSDAGKEFGVVVAQENVRRCQAGSLAFLREMAEKLGEKAHFVLDVKQAVRAEESPFEMLETLGSRIVHVHISDHGPAGDCLLPGRGTFAMRRFLERLEKMSPDCSVMLELYRQNFGDVSELADGCRVLSNLIADIESPLAER